MQPECKTVDRIAFGDIPHSSPIFLDYLYQFDRVSRFYAPPDSAGKSVAEHDAGRRARMADILERQNRGWGPLTAAQEKNLGRFRAGASAVVSGQQVSLFGGPLYALLKTLTAIKLARSWSEKWSEKSATGNADFVPIFWLATEDHDLAEVNHGNLPSPSGALTRFFTNSSGASNAPMSAVTLNSEITSVVEAAAQMLGNSDVAGYLRAAYVPGQTMGSAFARLWTSIFSAYGLLLLDPSDPEVHAVASPLLVGAIERSAELNEGLLERGRELEALHYHPQVKVTASSTSLFVTQGGSRLPVRRAGDEFGVGHQRFMVAELAELARAHPEQLSGSVLLRPVIQDFLLPTAAYVGGPAEVAYFAQASVNHEKLLGRRTLVLPRISATLVDPKISKRMQRYGLTLQDTFGGVEHTRELIAARSLPRDLNSLFDRAVAGMDGTLDEIKSSLANVDKTLVASGERAQGRLRYQLERLRKRAARAHLRLQEQGERHAEEIVQAVYPHKNLQEREIMGVYFLARYGMPLLDRLLECPVGVDHLVFYL